MSATAVLPDARALDDLASRIYAVLASDEEGSPHVLAAMRGDPNARAGDLPMTARRLAVLAQQHFATPPASDAAVPAGSVLVPVEPTEAMVDNAFNLDNTEQQRRDTWKLMIAAAPKVASDTGAKLSDDDAIIAEFAFLYREYGLADDATLAPDAIGLKRKVLAALATDATDGATGGGEEWCRGCKQVRSVECYKADCPLATTPGGDLLEQAEIVDVVLPIIVQNTPSIGRSAHHVACDVADAVFRALSARNQTDDGGEK